MENVATIYQIAILTKYGLKIFILICVHFKPNCFKKCGRKYISFKEKNAHNYLLGKQYKMISSMNVQMKRLFVLSICSSMDTFMTPSLEKHYRLPFIVPLTQNDDNLCNFCSTSLFFPLEKPSIC